MYYLCTYNLIVYSNYYRRKGRSSNSCLFTLCAVHFFAETVAYCHLHGSKRSARNRLLAGRRFVMTQKTVYLFKLLVIFLKSAVMFFKKLVMFCPSLVDDCCSLLYWLIMHKSALDKIWLIKEVKGGICKVIFAIWKLYQSSSLPSLNKRTQRDEKTKGRFWLNKDTALVFNGNLIVILDVA